MSLLLAVRNLLAHPVRFVLTFNAVALGVLLICVSESVVTGLSASVDQASTRRLWVQSAVSLYVSLPLSYEGKLGLVPGVEDVCKFQWFGGVYRDESSFFPQFAVDAGKLEAFYPEIEILEGSFEAFERERRGCLIGEGLAEKFGWKVGDTIPILGKIFPRADGEAWEFLVRGIYRSTTASVDQSTLYFSYEYLRESIESGGAFGPDGVGVYVARTAPGTESTEIMRTIDELYENGPLRVQSTPEAEFNRQFITMLGNVPALLRSVAFAVLFAVFFAVLNTMLMAARERTHDIGIQKALGFTDGSILRGLLVESLILALSAGLFGIGLAALLESKIIGALGSTIPGIEVSSNVMWVGVGIAAVVGLIAGVVPGWRASRLSPVQALRADA